MKPPKWAAFAQMIPEAVWGPSVAALVAVLLGLAGQITGRPLLFPSLGPTIFLIALQPADPMVRFANTTVGHALGLAIGYLAVLVTGAAATPAASADAPLPNARLAAAVIALPLTFLAQKLCRAPHVPAAATTLLCALGFLPLAGRAALEFLAATLLVALFAVLARRLRAGTRPEPPLERSAGAA